MSGCFAWRSTPKDGCKSLQWAVSEQGLEFLCPDIGVAVENFLLREWKPGAFVNIACHPTSETPLRFGEGVEITGGSIALTALAERLRMLPEKGGELFL